MELVPYGMDCLVGTEVEHQILAQSSGAIEPPFDFFDFTGNGTQAMRLDAMSILGEILTDVQEVVLSVTRIR